MKNKMRKGLFAPANQTIWLKFNILCDRSNELLVASKTIEKQNWQNRFCFSFGMLKKSSAHSECGSQIFWTKILSVYSDDYSVLLCENYQNRLQLFSIDKFSLHYTMSHSQKEQNDRIQTLSINVTRNERKNEEKKTFVHNIHTNLY